MNQVQTFSNPLFGTLPVITLEQKQYFGATESAALLGYSNTHDALNRHTRKDGVVFHEVIDNVGRKQNKKFISEGNLYRLITRSKLPEAEKFETWVFDEVIPTIRKHGAYATPQTIETILDNPDFGIQLLTNLKEERSKRQAAEQQIEEQRPKVVFAEAYEVSDDTITVKEMANLLKQKGIDTGEQRLYRWFRENGYVCSRGSYYNLPTQRALDMGLFQIKKGVRTGTGGALRQTRTTKVTGKGQVYFVNKFIEQASAI